jgi:hypothetical protein
VNPAVAPPATSPSPALVVHVTTAPPTYGYHMQPKRRHVGSDIPPLRTLDLTGSVSAPERCSAADCEATQTELDQQRDRIVDQLCRSWDPAAHRQRGKGTSESSGGLISEVECDRSVRSQECFLRVKRALCVVDGG